MYLRNIRARFHTAVYHRCAHRVYGVLRGVGIGGHVERSGKALLVGLRVGGGLSERVFTLNAPYTLRRRFGRLRRSGNAHIAWPHHQ